MRRRMLRIALCCLVALAGCVGDDESDRRLARRDGLSLPDFHGRFGSPSIVRDGDTLHAYFAIQAYARRDRARHSRTVR